MNWKRTFHLAAALALLLCFVGTSQAQVTTFVTGAPQYQAKDNDVFIISNTLDFNDLRTAGPSGTGQLAGVTRSAVVQLLYIPAGTVVLDVGAKIYSAWGTSGVTCGGVTIGDGTDVDGWITTMDWGPSASGVSNSRAGVSGAFLVNDGGKYYSAADTIDATIPATSHAAYARVTDFVLQIWATAVKPSAKKAYKKPSPAI